VPLLSLNSVSRHFLKPAVVCTATDRLELEVRWALWPIRLFATNDERESIILAESDPPLSTAIGDPAAPSHCEAGGTPVPSRDISPAIEFACWIVVGLAPILRWINGAAVTRDQYFIQIALTSIALAGALSLRFYNYRAQGHAGRASSDQSHLE
jgi:hypothetical protein